MTWLLNLYPPAWQKRYRREVEAHLSEGHWPVLRTSLDLIAGAVDAWQNPGSIPESPDTGERNMVTASRCHLDAVSKEEGRRSAAWMIGTSLLLTGVAVALDKTFGEHILIQALLYSSFFIALTISSRHTYLKPYSPRARTVITLLAIPAWYGFFLAVTALGTVI